MFGLENQKKSKKVEPFVFDLENELRSPGAIPAFKQKIEGNIQTIKEVLRSGDDKAEFDQFGILLHGYASLLKAMMRLNAK
jgi:hypothetical protein